MRHLKRAKLLDPSILDTAMIKIDSILFLSKDTSYVDSVAEEAKDLIVKELSDYTISLEKKEKIKKVIKKSILSMPIGSLLGQNSMKILFKNGHMDLNVSGDSLIVKGKSYKVTVQEVKKSWLEQAKDLWWLWLVIILIMIFIRRIL